MLILQQKEILLASKPKAKCTDHSLSSKMQAGNENKSEMLSATPKNLPKEKQESQKYKKERAKIPEREKWC
jgi:hypothetical protein